MMKIVLSIIFVVIAMSVSVWVMFFVPGERVFSQHEVENISLYKKAGVLYWNPEKKLVTAFREQLPDYISSNSIINKNRMSSLDNYNYQYYGYKSNKDKYIEVTAYCTGIQMIRMYLNGINTSIEEPFDVLDGGPCIFNATYSVSKGSVIGVFVHGM